MSGIRKSSRKRQNVRLLNSDIKIKKRQRLRYAPIGIIGNEQVGKKTLAYRFGAMNQGAFEDEVESRYYYKAVIDLDTRSTDGDGVVYLKSYVVPPPSDLPAESPPSYRRELDHFAVFVIVFSVTNRSSFATVADKLHHLRHVCYPRSLPFILIVGNKMDLDRKIYPQHVTFNEGLITAMDFRTNYDECSAKENTNVDIILEQILLRIIQGQP